MSQDQQTNDSASIPCSQGCGFFGRASTNNMCSKCYKEHCSRNGEIVKKMDLNSTVPTPVVDKPDVSIGTVATPAPSSSSSSTISPVKAVTVAPSLTRVAEPNTSESSKKPRTMVDKSRCAHCQKKVGLTAIECRCGNVYCGAHRMAEKHACTFDFKSFGRSFIEKTNERVVAESLVDKL